MKDKKEKPCSWTEKDVFVTRETTAFVTLARTKPVCPRSCRNFHVSGILET
jgi:hypothetical protein